MLTRAKNATEIQFFYVLQAVTSLWYLSFFCAAFKITSLFKSCFFSFFRHDITNFDRTNKACYNLNKGSKSSFHMGKALIHRWQHSKVESYVTNIFYNDPYTTCYLANKYIQPQLLSSHVNLGSGDNTCQNSISFHLENNGTLVNKAYWVSFLLIFFWFYILF